MIELNSEYSMKLLHFYDDQVNMEKNYNNIRYQLWLQTSIPGTKALTSSLKQTSAVLIVQSAVRRSEHIPNLKQQ